MGKYTERWNALKPEKPKRPAVKFASFLAEFKREKPDSDFFEAAAKWWGLSDFEKIHFNHNDEAETYRRAYANYKSICNAMKKPPGSYATFVRFYWKEKRPNMKGNAEERQKKFADVQKKISTAWRNFTEEEKAVFKKIANLSEALFEREQEAVISGKRRLNLNWLQEGTEEAIRIMRKRFKEDVNKVNDNDKDDDDDDEDNI